MGEMRILCKAGDTKITWSANNETEVEAAKKQFKELTVKGFTAYHVKKTGFNKGKQGEVMEDFDSKAEAIIFVPKVMGG